MERLPTPVFRPGESHGLYSPWGHSELDTTELLSLFFTLTASWLTQKQLWSSNETGFIKACWVSEVFSKLKLFTIFQKLCDPIDGSPPGSLVPGILQARTLEWVAISFSNAWKWKVKVKSLSRVRLFETPWTAAHQAPPSMGFSRQEYWSGVPLPSPILKNIIVLIMH